MPYDILHSSPWRRWIPSRHGGVGSGWRLRHDSEEICVHPLPVSGSPMIYMHDGEQYIVVAVSGHLGEVLAYRLQHAPGP